MGTDWHQWHASYRNLRTWQAQRLAVVRRQIRYVLDTAPPGPLTIVDPCAGQGVDLLGVLHTHPRRNDVYALLVEADEANAAEARELARGLDRVDVLTGDASLTDHYTSLPPADLLLLCGIFPHITWSDRLKLVNYAAALTARGGAVIWTIHRYELAQFMTGLFASAGFDNVWLTPPEMEHAVGVAVFAGCPPLRAGEHMFTFVGLEALSDKDR